MFTKKNIADFKTARVTRSLVKFVLPIPVLKRIPVENSGISNVLRYSIRNLTNKTWMINYQIIKKV